MSFQQVADRWGECGTRDDGRSRWVVREHEHPELVESISECTDDIETRGPVSEIEVDEEGGGIVFIDQIHGSRGVIRLMGGEAAPVQDLDQQPAEEGVVLDDQDLATVGHASTLRARSPWAGES